MSYEECMQFERKIAFHMAPSLLGIKCANLVSLSRNEFDIPEHLKRFNRRISVKGLKMKILCTCNDRVLLLLYHEEKLLYHIRSEGTLEILRKNGYSEFMTLNDMLVRLSERIQCSTEFPHEIGIFLGYPPDDVMGFIQNKGENYLICGYWKVYGDKERAERTFKNYDKCRNFLCNKLNQGVDLYHALKIY